MKAKEKVILVTGGARGIGKAIALAFARINYNVVITALPNEEFAKETIKEIKSLGVKASVIYTDFTLPDAIPGLFSTFEKQYDHLDVLVNNAGWTKYIPHDDLEELSDEVFDKVITIDLKSVFLCIKQAVKRMKGDNNNVINIASIAAFNGVGSNIAYCAAKAGVITMTKSLARVFGKTIRFNAIAPGLTDTDMTKTGPAVYRTEQTNATPMNRIATPQDIADAAVSIVDKMQFINGQTIVIDGGKILNG